MTLPYHSNVAHQRLGIVLCITILLASSFVPAQSTQLRPELGKVALVLGGGSARGTAHLGIIKALNEAGVPIDMIVSTSMGSLIGGLYAAGFSTDTLADLIVELSPEQTAELSFPPRGGILDAKPLEILLGALLKDMTIAETSIPFFPVATALEMNEPVALTSGSLASAIHASIAIPLLFVPVEIDARHYYDGGIKAAVPVLIAKEFGAEVVIAVDVTREVLTDPDNIIRNTQVIFLNLIEGFNVPDLQAADVVIDPGLRRDSYMSFDRASHFVEQGYAQATKQLPDILASLVAKGIALRPAGDLHAHNALNAGWQQRLHEGHVRAAKRPQPFHVSLDVGLEPSVYQGSYQLPRSSAMSIAQAGFDLSGGQLGNFSIGTSAGLSLRSDASSLAFRAAYQPDYWLRLDTVWQKDIADRWELSFGLHYDYTDFQDVSAELSLEWLLLAKMITATAAFEMTGFQAQTRLSLPTSATYLQGAIDVRGALSFDDYLLRLRGFMAASSASEHAPALAFGQPVLMRGVPTSAATSILVGNIEAGWRIRESIPLAEVVVLRPELWAFVDYGYASPNLSAPLLSLGFGTGVSGELFGFEPFSLAMDVGYGLSSRHVTFGLRSRMWPRAFELDD